MIASALALLGPLLFASQQAPSRWYDAPTPEAAEVALRDCLAALPAELRLRHAYLIEIGQMVEGTPPTVLRGPSGHRCMVAHLPLLAAHAVDEAALVDWFATRAAMFVAADCGNLEGAIELLAATEPMLPQPTRYWPLRRGLEIDYRTELQQLATAYRLCDELEPRISAPFARAQLMRRRGSIELLLGRLDQAARHFDAAELQLAAVDDVDAFRVPSERFLLFLRRLDLAEANEQFGVVAPRIAAFEAQREATAQLRDDERAWLRVHKAAALYHATQREPERIGAAVAALDALLTGDEVDAGTRAKLSVWLADLELRSGHVDRTQSLLLAVGTSASPAIRALAAVVASEHALYTGKGDDELIAHEARLRAVLQDMIAEWRDVACNSESTGFLRLGARLRVLGQLIVLTSRLHGDERALDDVLAVQSCTAVSRSRGAVPMTLAALRERLLGVDDGVLVFVPAWNDSHVFAFDRTHFVHELLPRASELRELATQQHRELLALAHEPLSDTTLPTLRQQCRRLADVLLPPSVHERMRGWHHLVVTGSNLIGGPTFACLPWDDDVLLGERFAIAITASLPLLARLSDGAGEPVAAGTLSMQVFATLAPAAAFAQRNRVAVADELGGARWDAFVGGLPAAVLHVGADATVTAYGAAALDGGSPLTLLLAHGELPLDDSPPALGLSPDELHPDGLLTPEQIRAARSRGIIVLASCHGAQGPLRMGDDDGADSLADAFLFAGATAVVASRAQLRASVHVDAAATLIAAIAAGESPAEALRRARIAAGGADAAQRYRASQLELIGLGTAPLARATLSTGLWWWALGGAVVTVSIVLAGGLFPSGSRRAAAACRGAAAADD